MKSKDNLTASFIFDNYADSEGLVSLKILKKLGWSKQKAKDEGLIIKEEFHSNEK